MLFMSYFACGCELHNAVYRNAFVICTDISYVKVTTGLVSSSPVPPGGTQRRKARNAGEMLAVSLYVQLVFLHDNASDHLLYS